eukprot:755317-Hanusia_phi.AAC.7
MEHLKVHPSLSMKVMKHPPHAHLLTSSKLREMLASSADGGNFPNYIDHTRLFRWSAERSVIERVAAAVIFLLLRRNKRKPFLQEVALLSCPWPLVVSSLTLVADCRISLHIPRE